MNIHISRNGQEIGIYDDSQLAQLASSSQILPTDTAWKEGMAGWEPLANLHPELFQAATPPPQPPPQNQPPSTPLPPPQAQQSQVIHQPVQETATGSLPKLWNPSAAANWSLLFSPIFGALIHRENWKALGEPTKAKNATFWAVGAGLFILVLSLLPLVGIEDTPGIVFLIYLFVWYFVSAQPQIKYVKEKFNNQYDKKGWGQPFSYGILGSIACGVLIILLGALAAYL